MAEASGWRVLVFRVGEVRCAADADVVLEILSAPLATRIPGAPAEVPGVVNVRGSLVTLVDLRRCLGLPSSEDETSLVLVSVGERTAGLVVDEVLDLVTLEAEAMADRAELPGVEARYVRAVGRQRDEAFALLDTEALVSPILSG